MKCATLILLLLPALLAAQEFQFRQEIDTIPVEINGWHPFAPWMGGMSYSNPAFADVDSDGDFDLFVGDFLGNLGFYPNLGDASSPNFFFESYIYDSITVDCYLAAVFRDLDADGDLDVLISTAGDGWLFFYRNTGTPQLPDYTREDTIWAQGMGPPYCFSPELVDIDADGDYDLFASNLGSVSFYQNNGTPQNYSFAAVTGSFAGAAVGSWADPTFCDIDGDSDYDLFIGNGAGRLYFYRNDGTPQQYDFTYVTNYYNILTSAEWHPPNSPTSMPMGISICS